MKLRFLLALWAGKLSVIALRVLRRRGTVLPGCVALKICPDFLKYAPYPRRVIAVTGTNGKTTVTNMLHDLLTADGQRVLTNQSGANEADGLSAMVVRGLSAMGKCRHDICVYEVDEHWGRYILQWMPPKLLVVTNLLRDSMMRNAHPGYMQMILNEIIQKSVRLVLNADDLFSAFLAPKNPRSYFGVDAFPFDGKKQNSLLQDGRLCPRCGRPLIWDVLHYSSVGRMHCPFCGLRSPEPDYLGMEVDPQNGSFLLREQTGSVRISPPNMSDFNIYNALAAAVVLRDLGYTRERVGELFRKLEITKIRFSVTKLGGTVVCRTFAKGDNAYANSRVFEYLRTQPGDQEIVLLVNYMNPGMNYSENTSWLYDCDFELLNTPKLRNIILCGAYAWDYRLRLRLAGIPEERISFADSLEDIPNRLKLFENDHIYILFQIYTFIEAIAVEQRVIDRVKEKIKP